MWQTFTSEEHLKSKTEVWDGFVINRNNILHIHMKETS